MIGLASSALALCLGATTAANAPALALRRFDLTYTATIPAAKGKGPVRIWLPVPQTGWDQAVDDLKVSSPVPVRITTEGAYGNRMMYVEASGDGPITVGWSARVSRREHRNGGGALTATEVLTLKRFLADDVKAPAHAPEVKLALAKATGGKDLSGDVKSRAVYDYVVSNMVYDKIAPGWGQGDTLRACSVGKGNCTDFHSLFISMCRDAAIPAKFAIGFTIPKPPGGDVPGYHCWAYYLSKEAGWIPVDASEAFKHPELKEYYFGGLTADRVELTQGRDVNLEPRQSGPALNYFLNPYAEQDGIAISGTEKKVSFKEVAP